MSVAIYCSYPSFLILECMSSVGSMDDIGSNSCWIRGSRWIQLDPLGSEDCHGSKSRGLRVAVLMWLTSIPRPRLYWSNPVE